MSNHSFMSRRKFLKTAAALGIGGAVAMWRVGSVSADPPDWLEFFKKIKDPAAPTDLEKQHLMELRLPVIAEDGANVPMIVSLTHPMEADHYIKSIQILNFKDPVVSKGVFHFTPANGVAHISTQLRMDGGDAEIFVVAECSQHGKWVASKKLKISLGGC